MDGRTVAGGGRWRPALKVLLVVAVLLLVHEQGARLVTWLGTRLQGLPATWGASIVVAAFLLYVVLLALPFVPGVEIGWTLMMLFGVEGVVMVYVATVLALASSFLVGRRVPIPAVAGGLDWLHLRRAAAFVRRLGPLSPPARLVVLVRDAPTRAIPFLARHRYLAVAVAFNLPGNALVGGGGGIALVAGMSGLFPFPRYLATVCLAVSPIPLVILASAGVPWLLE